MAKKSFKKRKQIRRKKSYKKSNTLRNKNRKIRKKSTKRRLVGG